MTPVNSPLPTPEEAQREADYYARVQAAKERRAPWIALGLLVAVVGVLAYVFSAPGGVSLHGGSQPAPGATSGADVSVRACRLSINPDGSVLASATLDNGGTSDEQANVIITLHFYGGTTTDDNSLLGNGYSLPPGSHYVTHNFSISADQTPIFCTAKLPY